MITNIEDLPELIKKKEINGLEFLLIPYSRLSHEAIIESIAQWPVHYVPAFKLIWSDIEYQEGIYDFTGWQSQKTNLLALVKELSRIKRPFVFVHDLKAPLWFKLKHGNSMASLPRKPFLVTARGWRKIVMGYETPLLEDNNLQQKWFQLNNKLEIFFKNFIGKSWLGVGIANTWFPNSPFDNIKGNNYFYDKGFRNRLGYSRFLQREFNLSLSSLNRYVKSNHKNFFQISPPHADRQNSQPHLEQEQALYRRHVWEKVHHNLARLYTRLYKDNKLNWASQLPFFVFTPIPLEKNLLAKTPLQQILYRDPSQELLQHKPSPIPIWSEHAQTYFQFISHQSQLQEITQEITDPSIKAPESPILQKFIKARPVRHPIGFSLYWSNEEQIKHSFRHPKEKSLTHPLDKLLFYANLSGFYPRLGGLADLISDEGLAVLLSPVDNQKQFPSYHIHAPWGQKWRDKGNNLKKWIEQGHTLITLDSTKYRAKATKNFKKPKLRSIVSGDGHTHLQLPMTFRSPKPLALLGPKNQQAPEPWHWTDESNNRLFGLEQQMGKGRWLHLPADWGLVFPANYQIFYQHMTENLRRFFYRWGQTPYVQTSLILLQELRAYPQIKEPEILFVHLSNPFSQRQNEQKGEISVHRSLVQKIPEPEIVSYPLVRIAHHPALLHHDSYSVPWQYDNFHNLVFPLRLGSGESRLLLIQRRQEGLSKQKRRQPALSQ